MLQQQNLPHEAAAAEALASTGVCSLGLREAVRAVPALQWSYSIQRKVTLRQKPLVRHSRRHWFWFARIRAVRVAPCLRASLAPCTLTVSNPKRYRPDWWSPFSSP